MLVDGRRLKQVYSLIGIRVSGMIICNSSVLEMNMARRQVHSHGAVVCGIVEAYAMLAKLAGL